MTTIYINGIKAALKKEQSFEYTRENRAFSGAEGYTLEIVFPLDGCDVNREIFGDINRHDVPVSELAYDCRIVCKGFDKSGVMTITQVSESELKGQFLEGMSARNYNIKLDSVYINEMDLGSAGEFAQNLPSTVWNPRYTGEKCVALPWVNDSTGLIHNLAVYEKPTYNDDMSVKHSGAFKWHEECKRRSFQPYLLYILKAIFEQIGFSADLSALEAVNKYRYLLICHALPASWGISGFARLLPHWTITQLLENLELFLNGVFEIDGVRNTVVFKFNDDVAQSVKPVKVDDVVFEHTVDVTADYEEAKCDYIGVKNIAYEEQENSTWKYLKCDWFLEDNKSQIAEYATMQSFLSFLRQQEVKFSNGYALNLIFDRNGAMNKIFHVADVDTYFMWRPMTKVLYSESKDEKVPNAYTHYFKLQPLNICGDRIVRRYADEETQRKEELGISPVNIEMTELEYGEAMFISFESYNDKEEERGDGQMLEDDWQHVDPEQKAIDQAEEENASLRKSPLVMALEEGEKEKAEYFSHLTLGWWGIWVFDGLQEHVDLPHPWVEDIIVDNSAQSRRVNTPFRISGRRETIAGVGTQYEVDIQMQYTFKFLADEIPDPMALFLIRGKKYICAEIKTSFSQLGMSRLMTGKFYRLKD